MTPPFRISRRGLVVGAGLLTGLSRLGAQRPPQRLAWFHEAKFGLLLRWGLYSIPAGNWKGRSVPGPSESILDTASIPLDEYDRLAAQFQPATFDPEAWVKVAIESGVRYLLFTAQGSDGFAMYRSGANRRNVYDATPFHRNPLRELAEAASHSHLRFGVYFSAARVAGRVAEAQIRELLTAYGPFAMVWLDGASAQALAPVARQLQPEIVVAGAGGAGDVACVPQDQTPPVPGSGAWQHVATLNGSGAYKDGANQWKTPERITFELADAVSRGGNYLVELGPLSDGGLPRPGVVNLEGQGPWLAKNGEAIFGAASSPLPLSTDAWRATASSGAKPGRIYVELFAWPRPSLELPAPRATVSKAYLLVDPNTPVPFVQRGQTLSVMLPEHPPAEHAFPERIDPRLTHLREMEHVRVVLVLETR